MTSSDTQLATVPTAQDAALSSVASSAGVYDYTLKLAALSPDERRHYLEKASKIKMDDMSSISHYGSELSQVVSQNGNTLLESVRGNSTSEAVELTNELLSQLNLIDIDELNTTGGFKGFLRRIPLVRSLVRSVDQIMVKYDTIADNVEKISKKIGSAKIVAMRDNATLEQIYTNNKLYIEQLRELIIAAKLRLQEVTDEIQRMQENPLEYESYRINDANNFRNALEKRISDMVTTEYILHQNLFQIRAIQSNNIAISDKSDNIVNHIIPIWKNQLSISIVMNNQKASIDAQRRITDTTNDILRKNAAILKTNSIAVAKAAEESVVSLDTLRETTQSLMDTLTEVRKIQNDASKQHGAIETTLLEYGKKLEATINESVR